MKIEQTIEQYDGYANVCMCHNLTESQKEFEQIAEWLRELQERRKGLGIVHCGECVNFAERDFCKVAGHNVHRKSNCMQVFGAERRTDD